MDTSRYLDLFVQEATEHLEALGNDLVAIEREGGSDVIGSAFRHAHSIKGMAASMGYTPIADLAHRLEDLLEPARQEGTPIAAEGIDAALAVTDAIGALVQAAARSSPLESAGVDVSALCSRLEAAVAQAQGGRGAPASSNVEARHQPPAAASECDEAVSRGRSGEAVGRARPHLKVSVLVSGTSKVPAVRAFLVHKRLGGLGEIISCEPSLAELKSGRLPEGRLEVELSTDSGEEAVSRELSTISELETIEVETVAVPAPGGAADWSSPAPAVAAKPAAEPIRTVRVRTDLLDGFMEGVGELLLAADRLRELAALEEQDSVSPLGEAVDRLGRIAKTLHRRVMATRMTPLSAVTDRLPRVQRETLRHLDKQATLEVEGADIEIDRAILDEIESPLGHLVRNCIDHGIEPPGERLEAGKPTAGRVKVVARRDRDRVLVEISDDGRGMDASAIRDKALEAGIIDERAASKISRSDALLLACHPGLSTAARVTEISGRGVGLDVVKATVESLGGSLEVESEPGSGTLFRLALPLTIAIQRLLLVGVGEEVFAVPVNKVLQVQEVPRARRTSSRGHEMVPFLDGLVRVHHLPEILALADEDQCVDPLPHVVVEGPFGKAVALVADRLCGQIEGVVRPLGRPLDLLGGLSGVSMLPDGRPVLVLDLASLVRTAESLEAGVRSLSRSRETKTAS